jgi:hypothetical protein
MRNHRNDVFSLLILIFFLSYQSAFAADKSTNKCKAEGIAAEAEFAEKVCNVAATFGLYPTLVHSYGAGGVDIFISEAEADKLQKDSAKLKQITISITNWAKQNYKTFNFVEITIIGGDSKIARGSKLGNKDTIVELYQIFWEPKVK